MICKTLGHYQITSLPGKGSMGKAHQGKDQKLDWHVAIKVPAEEFAKDAGRPRGSNAEQNCRPR